MWLWRSSLQPRAVLKRCAGISSATTLTRALGALAASGTHQGSREAITYEYCPCRRSKGLLDGNKAQVQLRGQHQFRLVLSRLEHVDPPSLSSPCKGVHTGAAGHCGPLSRSRRSSWKLIPSGIPSAASRQSIEITELLLRTSSRSTSITCWLLSHA